MTFHPNNVVLQNDLIRLVPLQETNFEALYLVASDPLIWEQHPDRYRYKREVFQKYFDSAIASQHAFLIFDNTTGELIGSSRYHDYHAADKRVEIGYTFIARSHWGGKFNGSLKKLMLDYAFQYVDTVYFVIGATNLRSQKAVEKIGGIKVENSPFHNTQNNTKVVYKIDKK